MQNTIIKRDAIRIITEAAKDYSRLLEGVNYLFIFRDRQANKIDFFETVFLPRNFQHLTGIEMIDSAGNIIKKPTYFYQKCLNNRVKETEIVFRADGTTQQKLQALPKLIRFLNLSKMTTLYSGTRPKLTVERLTGTTNYCLGFTLDKKYYVPSSCLLEDIRNFGESPSQILAILSKSAYKKEKVYRNIRYVAKGISLNRVVIPTELATIIDLSEYEEK